MGIERFIPKHQYRYYYEKLPFWEQKVYQKMVAGFLGFQDSIPCGGCLVDRIEDIFNAIRLDIPELFYVTAITIEYTTLICDRCRVIPEYRFEEDTVTGILDAMGEISVRLKLRTEGCSELEKEQAIHDLLASSVEYKDVDAPYSHEAPGALLYGIGVCEGISKAFKYLADRLRLQSVVVTGMGSDQDSEEPHAWNLCCIDGNFYHLDVTFDATISSGCIRYDYFNLSDEEIASNHSWTHTLPSCPAGMAYYSSLGLYFDSRTKLAQYLRSQPKDARTLVFQLPLMGCDPQAVMDAVHKTIADNLPCGLFEQKRFSFSYNRNRMVFQVNIA